MLLFDLERFEKLITYKKYPVQIIWAGKPYPMDYHSIEIFNHSVKHSKSVLNLTVQMGYEIELSKKLKTESDIWLNDPRITQEALGTSGMKAAMNGSLNLSTNDGWMPEFSS